MFQTGSCRLDKRSFRSHQRAPAPTDGATMAARRARSRLRAAMYQGSSPSCFALVGSGKASRSTLPSMLVGIASISTNIAGNHIIRKIFQPSSSWNSPRRARGMKERHTRPIASRPLHSPRAASAHTTRTEGWRRSALATSFNSMRKPLILTCSSTRPWNEICPSGRQVPRSPVR